jgi:hypothetical protein
VRRLTGYFFKPSQIFNPVLRGRRGAARSFVLILQSKFFSDRSLKVLYMMLYFFIANSLGEPAKKFLSPLFKKSVNQRTGEVNFCFSEWQKFVKKNNFLNLKNYLFELFALELNFFIILRKKPIISWQIFTFYFSIFRLFIFR